MKKKKILLTASVILLVAAAVFTGKYLLSERGLTNDEPANPSLSSYIVTETDDKADKYKNQSETETSDSSETESTEEYVSPIDFDKLKKDNADTCAWLEIPESDFSFPVMQHPTDNSYYLTHDFERNYSIYGAAYIEDYNKNDFSDMAAVIYGHNINNGEWFGQLQTIFTDPERFEECRNIKLYLPNEERTYKVFAAVPYDDSHILYYNDFSNDKVYDDFIEEIADTRALNSIIDKSALPSSGTRLLILSTCLKGDYSHRFLVLAAEC